MPELPEVETIVRGLNSALTGLMITDVIVRQDKLRAPITADLNANLSMQKIIRVTRRAKYLLITTTNGTVIVHLGMSGRLILVEEGIMSTRHDHVDIVLDNAKILRYNDPRRFGALLWTNNDPGLHPYLKVIGIEPFDPAFDAEYLQRLALGRTTPIKSFIMNSHMIAGIGNIYAAEALFSAKIHPLSPAGSLSLTQYTALVKAIVSTLEAAIIQGGTTLKDFVNSSGNPGYFSQQLLAYGRAGRPCKVCDLPLRTMQLGQRVTVFCENCQVLDDKYTALNIN